MDWKEKLRQEKETAKQHKVIEIRHRGTNKLMEDFVLDSDGYIYCLCGNGDFWEKIENQQDYYIMVSLENYIAGIK